LGGEIERLLLLFVQISVADLDHFVNVNEMI